MENVLSCILLLVITFPVSFYAAPDCLWGLIRLLGVAELGAVSRAPEKMETPDIAESQIFLQLRS
jgi:hypothetical protein